MNILYLGDFRRSYDTEVYIAKTLSMIGHRVVCINSVKNTIQDVENVIKRNHFDFALCGKGIFYGIKEHLRETKIFFKERGLMTVGWFFDIVLGTARERENENIRNYFWQDVVCSTDGGHDESFKKLGINHYVLRQGIYEPEAVMGNPNEAEKNDIIFVGGISHYQWFKWKHRSQLVRFLADTYGNDFRQYGRSEQLRGIGLNNVIAASKVVVGDSLYSPNYWSNRLYEMIGRGAFLIFPEIPGIEEEFTPGKHFVTWKIGDWGDLQDKIEFYRSFDDEREKIRKAGFEYCKKYHTYTERCKKLIKIVEKELNKAIKQ